VKESGLPLVVRYPKRYAQGLVVEYAIDSEATDTTVRERLLGELLAEFPRSQRGDEPDEDEPILMPGARADVAQGPDRSLQIRFCPTHVHGDGTYDHIKLMLRHEHDRWRVHAIEVTWFLYN
jgi:hypothetical protein